MEFRRASAEDRDVLDGMTLAGVRFWGHDVDHPDAFEGLSRALASAEGPENFPVYVFEPDGQVLGFFELRDRGEHVELLRMFLRTDLIGRGYGRRLWSEAVAQASKTHDQMLIMSDPKARGFYEAMGATLEIEIEVTPGFVLGKYWFTLGEVAG